MTQIKLRNLSHREQQVANLLLSGAANSEIASELCMSIRTVKAYMHRLFCLYQIEKGGVRRVRLAVLIYREQQEHDGL